VSSSQNFQDKKINQKQNNLTHFVLTLCIPHRISSLSNFSLSQTSLASSLSSSNLFIVFSLSLSFSNLFRASSLSFSNLFSFFLCFWITHTQHHGEHQIFSFISLSFSLTQNTIFLILHTSSPFLQNFISVFLTQTFRFVNSFSFLRFFIVYGQECFRKNKLFFV